MKLHRRLSSEGFSKIEGNECAACGRKSDRPTPRHERNRTNSFIWHLGFFFFHFIWHGFGSDVTPIHVYISLFCLHYLEKRKFGFILFRRVQRNGNLLYNAMFQHSIHWLNNIILKKENRTYTISYPKAWSIFMNYHNRTSPRSLLLIKTFYNRQHIQK